MLHNICLTDLLLPHYLYLKITGNTKKKWTLFMSKPKHVKSTENIILVSDIVVTLFNIYLYAHSP